jgi:hypothetical protein
MSRRALKVVAISYAVKTVLVAALWLAAPDLVRQARDRALAAFSTLMGTSVPASAAIRQAAPHGAAGAVLRPAAQALPSAVR